MRLLPSKSRTESIGIGIISLDWMTITEETRLPGFKSAIHAFGYQLAKLSPDPKELSLGKHGLEFIAMDIYHSYIFPKCRGYYFNAQRHSKHFEAY